MKWGDKIIMDKMIIDIQKYYNNDIEKLSKDLNITKEYWYMIRDGKRKPSDKLIFKISEKTKIDFKKMYIFFVKLNNKMLNE